MRVGVVGTGYVGLVSGTCFAEMGHSVTCLDIDKEKIELLKKGGSPIYEPGLPELLKRNIAANRLSFSSNYSDLKDSQAIFLAVGTPSTKTGDSDLSYLYSAAGDVAQVLSEGTLVVIKSTVPVGTWKEVEDVIKKKTEKKFYIVNNPEFLKEGSAIDDFMRPDRVVIGTQDPFAANIMEELYFPLVRQGNPIFKMTNSSAEVTKYASNCFLATKISFINEMSRLCDVTDSDIEEVRRGMMADKRIGHHFLYPGPGYGGSCFPKDVKALISTGKKLGLKLKVVQAAEDVNEEQKVYLLQKVLKHFGGDIRGKTFTIWGVAFKPNTDDVREAPALKMVTELIKKGATINLYDPVATDNFIKALSPDIESIHMPKSFQGMYESLNESHGLIVLTDWPEFKTPSFGDMKLKLKEKVVFDGRNLYDAKKVLDSGFSYYGIGKLVPEKKS